MERKSGNESVLYRFLNYPIFSLKWNRKYKKTRRSSIQQLTSSEVVFQVIMEVIFLGLCSLFYGGICMITEEQSNDPVSTDTDWMRLGVRKILTHPQMVILVGIQLYLFYLTTAFSFVQSIFKSNNGSYYRVTHYPGYWLALDAVQFMTDLAPTIILAKCIIKFRIIHVFANATLQFCRWRAFVTGLVLYFNILKSA